MANGNLSREELRRMLMLMYGQGVGAPPYLPQQQNLPAEGWQLGGQRLTPSYIEPYIEPYEERVRRLNAEFAPAPRQITAPPLGGRPGTMKGPSARVGGQPGPDYPPPITNLPNPVAAADRYLTEKEPADVMIDLQRGAGSVANAVPWQLKELGALAGEATADISKAPYDYGRDWFLRTLGQSFRGKEPPTATPMSGEQMAGAGKQFGGGGKFAMGQTISESRKNRSPSLAAPAQPQAIAAKGDVTKEEFTDTATKAINERTPKEITDEIIKQIQAEITGTDKLPPKPVLDRYRENPDSFVSLLKSVFVGETKQEQKIKFLENLRDIAEGMGNIRAYTAADLRVGLGPGSQPPFIAEGFRTQIAREEDKFTPEEAQTFAQAFGMKPEQLVGQSKSSFAKFMPGMVGQQRLQAAGANKVTSNIMAATRDFRGKAKPLKEKYVLASQALRALDSNNWNGDASAANTMIRSSGDNRITEYDFKRHTTRPGLWDSINDWLEKKLTSRLPEDIRQGMREVAEGVRKEMQLRVDEEAKFAAHNYSGLAGSEEELRQRFQTTFDEYGAGPDGEMVEMITPKGDVIQVHRSRVEDAKAAGAMEK